ncbi:hypothetical protein MMC24_006909 [Lignoscripta atroalba]|nr:hypothetical protein [Lignoscripta atroalba]
MESTSGLSVSKQVRKCIVKNAIGVFRKLGSKGSRRSQSLGSSITSIALDSRLTTKGQPDGNRVELSADHACAQSRFNAPRLIVTEGMKGKVDTDSDPYVGCSAMTEESQLKQPTADQYLSLPGAESCIKPSGHPSEKIAAIPEVWPYPTINEVHSKNIAELAGFCPQFELSTTSPTPELDSDAQPWPLMDWWETGSISPSSPVSAVTPDSLICSIRCFNDLDNLTFEQFQPGQVSDCSSPPSHAFFAQNDMVSPASPLGQRGSERGMFSMLKGSAESDLMSPSSPCDSDISNPMKEDDVTHNFSSLERSYASPIATAGPFGSSIYKNMPELTILTTSDDTDSSSRAQCVQSYQRSTPNLRIVTRGTQMSRIAETGALPSENLSPASSDLDQAKEITQNRFYAYQPWRSDHHTSHAGNDSEECDHADIDYPHPTDRERLVEDLRVVFKAQFDESMAKIRRLPVSPPAVAFIDSGPNAMSTLDSGIQALRKVLQGSTPTTFCEAFGICHLAYAAAFVIDPQYMLEKTEELFTDAMNWAQTITCPEDRTLFLDLAWQIWFPTPRDYPSPHFAAQSAHNPLSIHHLDQYPTPTLALTSAHFSSPQSGNSTLQTAPPLPGDLLAALQQGTILRMCMRHLDMIRFLTIGATRSPSIISTFLLSSSAFADYVKQNIMEPLIRYRGLEGFLKNVVETEKLLNRGVLTNLREVQVNLIYGGRRSSKSPELYRNFADAVTLLCGEASALIDHDFASRDRSYEHDVNTLVSILPHIEEHKRPLPLLEPSWPSTGELECSSTASQSPVGLESSDSMSRFDIDSSCITPSSACSSLGTRSFDDFRHGEASPAVTLPGSVNVT